MWFEDMASRFLLSIIQEIVQKKQKRNNNYQLTPKLLEKLLRA